MPVRRNGVRRRWYGGTQEDKAAGGGSSEQDSGRRGDPGPDSTELWVVREVYTHCFHTLQVVQRPANAIKEMMENRYLITDLCSCSKPGLHSSVCVHKV